MSSNKVFIAIVVAHALTGVASVANRYLVSYLDPSEIACLRYIFGALFVLVLFCLEKPQRPTQPYVLKSILLGVMFFALFPYLFAASFEYISAARGALLIASMPIWAMIIGHLTGRETFNIHFLISVILAMIGLGIALSDKLIGSGLRFDDLTGELLMIAAAIVGAIYSLLARSAFIHTAASIHTVIGMTAGFMVLAPFAVQQGVIQDLQQFNSQLLLIIVLFGCFTGGLAFYLFNWVIKRSSATFATLFVPLNPLVAMLLGWWLLDEQLTPMFILGSCIVILGLFIASRRPVLSNSQSNIG